MAQVYSVNMVGYINQSIPAGFSAIANQLNNSPDNRVTTLFATPAEGTRIYKFNPATGGFQFLQFVDGQWEGGDTTITLSPGEGAFIFAPTAFTHTFVGEVALSSTVNLPAGFSMVSSALPQSLPLSGAPPAGLGFPVAEGDRIYQYNPATGGFIFNQFVDGAWEGSGGGNPPTPAIGESFYAFNAGTAAKGWTRNFTVGP